MTDNMRHWFGLLAGALPFVSHAFVSPPAWAANTRKRLGLTARSVDGEGMIVSGLKAISTSSAIAQYLFVKDVAQFDDGYHNLNFIIEAGTEGLTHIIGAGPGGVSSNKGADLSHRFGEQDCILAFDNVFVPKRNIFALQTGGEPQGAQVQDEGFIEFARLHGAVRLRVKLEALYGLLTLAGRHIAKGNFDTLRDILADVALQIELLRGLESWMVQEPDVHPSGYLMPNCAAGAAYQTLASGHLRDVMSRIATVFAKGITSLPPGGQSLDIAGAFDYLAKSPEDLALAFHHIRALCDLVSGDFGARQLLFEENYLGGLEVAKKQLYQRHAQRSARQCQALAIDVFGP